MPVRRRTPGYIRWSQVYDMTDVLFRNLDVCETQYRWGAHCLGLNFNVDVAEGVDTSQAAHIHTRPFRVVYFLFFPTGDDTLIRMVKAGSIQKDITMLW